MIPAEGVACNDPERLYAALVEGERVQWYDGTTWCDQIPGAVRGASYFRNCIAGEVRFRILTSAPECPGYVDTILGPVGCGCEVHEPPTPEPPFPLGARVQSGHASDHGRKGTVRPPSPDFRHVEWDDQPGVVVIVKVTDLMPPEVEVPVELLRRALGGDEDAKAEVERLADQT